MSIKYSFSAVERYVVFTLHGERCYICHKPIDLMSVEVDHIIPESLPQDCEGFNAALEAFSLSKDFDVNRYENWMPVCTPCNRRKLATVFRATPIIQLVLQRAAQAAPRAREMEKKVLHKSVITKSLNTLQRAVSDGSLSKKEKELLGELLVTAEPLRAEERSAPPMETTPVHDVAHRIVHVDDNQRYASCVDSEGNVYRICLEGMLPDLSDRGTQIGILTLVQEMFDVTSVWDHSDGDKWFVFASRSRDGAIIELSRHEDRAAAIFLALARSPGELQGPGITARKMECGEGDFIELTIVDQPHQPYCFLIEEAGNGSKRCTPLGPTTLEALDPNKMGIGPAGHISCVSASPSAVSAQTARAKIKDPRLELVPEIVTSSLSQAVSAVKVAALYFSRVRLSAPALELERTAIVKNDGGYAAYKRPLSSDEAQLRKELALAEAEGVLEMVDLPSDRDEFKKHLDIWFSGIEERWPDLAYHAAIPIQGPRVDAVKQIVKHEATVATLLAMAHGIPTATRETTQSLFFTSYRKWLDEIHKQASPARSSRVRRDLAAFASLRRGIAWLDEYEMTEVLEARTRRADAATTFRGEFARLTETLTENPMSEAYKERCDEIFENSVQPAMAELNRQLREGRTQAIRKTVVSLPSAIGILGIGHLSQSMPMPLFAAAASSVGLYAVYEFFALHSSQNALRDGNVFTLLLEPPKKSP